MSFTEPFPEPSAEPIAVGQIEEFEWGDLAASRRAYHLDAECATEQRPASGHAQRPSDACLAHRIAAPPSNAVSCDPWLLTINMLSGPYTPPAVLWPAAHTRRVSLLRIGERDDDAELSPAEHELLDLISAGVHTPTALADALGTSLGTVHTRACRVRARGLIKSVRGTYRPMTSTATAQ